jgi:hypothetical protein
MESQADWLTATCGATGDQMAYLRLGESLVQSEYNAGNRRAVFSKHGYRGSHAGRASYGARADGCIISLSGDLAASAFDAVHSASTHVTRLDVAVTAVLDPPVLDIETAAYESAILPRPIRGAVAAATLIRNRDGTATFLLGKRTSERYLRVYNKDVESGEARYHGAHRYEVEIKGNQAGEAALRLHVAGDRPGWAQSLVYAHCADRGVLPVFPDTGQQALVPGLRRRSDVDGSLRWITASVAPSVGRILANGRGPDLLVALGLDGPSIGRILSSTGQTASP